MTVRTPCVLERYIPTDNTNVCWYIMSLLILHVCVFVCVRGKVKYSVFVG